MALDRNGERKAAIDVVKRIKRLSAGFPSMHR
jgi:hypothetical protein